MSGSRLPNEPPPSYAQATGSSAASTTTPSGSRHSDTSHLTVPGGASSSGKGGKDGIPASYRRSMEDEARPLPEGWVRTFDPTTSHQFFVDTTKDPPQSIWHHPYDDDDYLSTLPSDERERIEQDGMNRGKHHPSKEDIIGAQSEEDEDHQHATAAAAAGAGAGASASASGIPSELPPRPNGGKGKQPDTRTFGRKFKDKMTGMTHEQRVEDRRRRAEAEQKMYEQHLRMRQAMQQAAQTGQPQYVGKDRDGKDVYIEPPPPPQQQPYGGGYGYRPGAYGYNPYQPGVYSTPNARYIRPQAPYGRPGGPGFGGGYGMPLAIGGGLLGGLLLGDLLF